MGQKGMTATGYPGGQGEEGGQNDEECIPPWGDLAWGRDGRERLVLSQAGPTNFNSFCFQIAEITDARPHTGFAWYWRSHSKDSAFQSSVPPTKLGPQSKTRSLARPPPRLLQTCRETEPGWAGSTQEIRRSASAG